MNPFSIFRVFDGESFIDVVVISSFNLCHRYERWHFYLSKFLPPLPITSIAEKSGSFHHPLYKVGGLVPHSFAKRIAPLKLCEGDIVVLAWGAEFSALR